MDLNSLTKTKFRPDSIEEIRARLRTTNELVDVVVRKSSEPITKGFFRKTYTRKNNLQGQIRESWDVCFRELLQEGAKLKVFLDAAENNINVIDRTLLNDAKEFVKQFVKLGERPGCAPFNRLLKEAKNSKWSNLLSIDKSKRGLEYYVLLAGTKALKSRSSERDALEVRAREAVPMVGAPAGVRAAAVAPEGYVPEGSTSAFFQASKGPRKAQTVPLAERVAAAEEAARFAAGEENTGAGLGAAEKAGYKPPSGVREAWATEAAEEEVEPSIPGFIPIPTKSGPVPVYTPEQEDAWMKTLSPGLQASLASSKVPPLKGSVPRSGLVALARAVEPAPSMSPAAATLQRRLNALRGRSGEPNTRKRATISKEEQQLNAKLEELGLYGGARRSNHRKTHRRNSRR